MDNPSEYRNYDLHVWPWSSHDVAGMLPETQTQRRRKWFLAGLSVCVGSLIVYAVNMFSDFPKYFREWAALLWCARICDRDALGDANLTTPEMTSCRPHWFHIFPFALTLPRGSSESPSRHLSKLRVAIRDF